MRKVMIVIDDDVQQEGINKTSYHMIVNPHALDTFLEILKRNLTSIGFDNSDIEGEEGNNEVVID